MLLTKNSQEESDDAILHGHEGVRNALRTGFELILNMETIR